VRVRVGDARLYFDVAGMGLVPDGPTMRERPIIVCLHGGPGPDHSMLKPFLAPLADTAQLIFVDQRGHGRSDQSSPDCWNLETWIEDIYGLCEALELEAPIILGAILRRDRRAWLGDSSSRLAREADRLEYSREVPRRASPGDVRSPWRRLHGPLQ
jgi:hypothetical protein